MPDFQGYGWLLLDGLVLTLGVAIASMLGALALGLLAALGKLFAPRAGKILIEVYTTIVRGVPELVLSLLIYYGLPTLVQNTAAKAGYDLSLSINPFVAGIGTLTVIYAAFACEVFRAAYLALPPGQREAAYALGLNPVKATALISIIQLPELMRNADIAARSTRQPFTFFFAACLLYLAITAISMLGQARLERWAARGTTEARS